MWQVLSSAFCGKIVIMPATDQNSLYLAIIIAFLGFMIGLAKGGLGGLGSLLTPIASLALAKG